MDSQQIYNLAEEAFGEHYALSDRTVECLTKFAELVLSAMQPSEPSAEVWKEILDFGNCYEVSSMGVVRYKLTGKIVNDYNSGCGYRGVSLYWNGKRKKATIHRLVVSAFKGIPLGYEVNHKNGNKHDNRLENLELLTRSENNLHAYHVLGKKVQPIIATDIATGQIKEYSSIEDAIKDGFSSANIFTVLNGTRHSHKGHRFERAIVISDGTDDFMMDAERYNWLVYDHDNKETRQKCRDLLERLGAMSKSAADMAIDAAISEAKLLQKEG